MVIFTCDQSEETQAHLKAILPRLSGARLPLCTRYYAITAIVHQCLTEMQPLPACATSSLAALTVATQARHLAMCRQLWDGAMRCEGVRLFVVAFGADDETLAALVAWAVPLGVEVVSQRLCAEDGISLSARVFDALCCAPWRLTSRSQQPVHGDGDGAVAEDAVGEASEASGDSDGVADGESSDDTGDLFSSGRVGLDQPTRLRRGLDPDDVSRLFDELVHLVDDD